VTKWTHKQIVKKILAGHHLLLYSNASRCYSDAKMQLALHEGIWLILFNRAFNTKEIISQTSSCTKDERNK